MGEVICPLCRALLSLFTRLIASFGCYHEHRRLEPSPINCFALQPQLGRMSPKDVGVILAESTLAIFGSLAPRRTKLTIGSTLP